jgi:hypothetical protein
MGFKTFLRDAEEFADMGTRNRSESLKPILTNKPNVLSWGGT